MHSFTATYSHIWGMTKEKRLINSFALANLCDAMVTGVALMLPGFMEKGLMGAQLLADEKAIELLIVKTAITAFMIGIYALAVHHRHRWHLSIETALKIGTVLVWLVVAWNEFNVVLALRDLFL